MTDIDKDYITTLKERGTKSHAYSKHQLVGLMIADLLDDREHKSFYMRLARSRNISSILSIARDVSERISVSQKGAYFMKILKEKGFLEKLPQTQKIPKKKKTKKKSTQPSFFK